MPSYIFKGAQLTDFIHFKNTELPLDNQGLVIVRGDFESRAKSSNSNGAGKSLLFSSIPLLIQGQLPTGKMIARDSASLNVGLDFSISNHEYLISLNKNKYSIVRDSKPVTPHKKPDALKLIKSLFPEDALFNSTSFVSQFSPIYFSLINGTSAMRLKVIEDFLDQSKIDVWKNRIKEKLTKVQQSLSIKNDISVEIRTLSKEYKKLDHIDKLDIQKLIKKKRDLKESISSLRRNLSQKKNNRENSIKYKKARSRLRIKGKTATQIKTRIKSLTKIARELENSVSIIENCGESLDTYIKLGKPDFWNWELHIPEVIKPAKKPTAMKEPRVKKLLEEHKLLEFDRGLLVQSRSKLGRLKGKKKCPTCDHAINNKELHALLRDLSNKIEKIEKDRNRIRSKLAPAQAMWKIFTNLSDIDQETLDSYEGYGLEALREKLDKATTQLSFLEEQLPIVMSLKHLKKEKMISVKEIRLLEKRIDRAEIKLEDLIKRLERMKGVYRRKKDLKAKIENLISRKSRLINTTRDDSIFLPIFSKAFSSRDIKTGITMDFCKMLVSDWNLFSSELFTKKIEFSVGLEQGYPSFQFSYKNSKPADIRHLSGGERKRLIACMIPSILRLSPSTTNILIIDELDANLDSSGREAMLDFLPTLIDSDLGKNSIFFLTARKKLSVAGYSDWLVQRTDNRSRLIIN